jgi:hypothetical protein
MISSEGRNNDFKCGSRPPLSASGAAVPTTSDVAPIRTSAFHDNLFYFTATSCLMHFPASKFGGQVAHSCVAISISPVQRPYLSERDEKGNAGNGPELSGGMAGLKKAKILKVIAFNNFIAVCNVKN